MYDNNDVDDGDKVDNDDVGDDDDDDDGDDDDDDDGGGGGDDTYKIGSHRPPRYNIPDITNAYPCSLPLCVGVPPYLYWQVYLKT